MKRFLSFCLALILVLSLAGCSGGGNTAGTSQGTQDTQADKGLEVMGDNVTYDPNHLVNNGDPITIDWWVWATEDMFRSIAEAYQEIHPNVTINVINNPWDGFFTKLPLASTTRGMDSLPNFPLPFRGMRKARRSLIYITATSICSSTI